MLDKKAAFSHILGMEPVVVSGQLLPAGALDGLNLLAQRDPTPSRNEMAFYLCQALDWFYPTGKPKSPKAAKALKNLARKGLITLPSGASTLAGRPRRLAHTGEPLDPVVKLPRQVELVKGLHLVLVEGATDPKSLVWNELIAQQHPCGSAPLVGAQLRYLIGSDHGWLGAIGFGAPAFKLGPRDQWIGWNRQAAQLNLGRVIGLSRLLIRTDMPKCSNLASKVMSLALKRVASDWESRYGQRPLLVESFVDRSRFWGGCYRAANWRLIGVSQGRGRENPQMTPSVSPKDIYVYPLDPKARKKLQEAPPKWVIPCSIHELSCSDQWVDAQFENDGLGDERRVGRAKTILKCRLENPAFSFNQSFPDEAQAKGAYRFIANKSQDLNFESLLAGHKERTLSHMASEKVVLVPQDTTSLDFGGLKKTTGLGKINHEGSRGLHLHSALAVTGQGLPLGLVDAQCWARQDLGSVGRNQKTIDEKETQYWMVTLKATLEAARRMPRVQVVSVLDREGDIFELFDQSLEGPENHHLLVRGQHDRNLEGNVKLWNYMATQPVAKTIEIEVPRSHKRKERIATVQIRFAPVTILSSGVRLKRTWSPLPLYAVWVKEINPPPEEEGLEWMLLTTFPVKTVQDALQVVQYYRYRWRIEELHRMLKTGCRAEKREFETALHLERGLAFDLMVATRAITLVRLNRETPHAPAETFFSQEELEILKYWDKKKDPLSEKWTLHRAVHALARIGRGRLRKDQEPGPEIMMQGLERLSLLVEQKQLEKELES